MFKLLSGELIPLSEVPADGVILDPETGDKVSLDMVDPLKIYYLLINVSYIPKWINISFLDWAVVSKTKEAINLIESHPSRIFWEFLSINPAAMHLIEKNPELAHPIRLSENPAAIDFLKLHPELIEASGLCRNTNPRAVELYSHIQLDWKLVSNYCSNMEFLIENLTLIDWRGLSRNQAAGPIALLYPNQIDWFEVSINPGMIEVISRFPERVNRLFLLWNSAAIDIIEGFLEELLSEVADKHKIWIRLSMNPGAVRVMRGRKDCIVWEYMCRHPEAIDLIEEHFREQIENNEYFQEIRAMSSNSAALHILERYSDVLNYRELAANKGIYL